jgi:heptaprenyl diphosphate synthase
MTADLHSPSTLRARLALYASAAALLFLLERALPNPVPWVRLGLPNVVTLLVLLEHGPRAAAVVLAVRLLLGGLFAGTLFGPQGWLSAAGGSASLIAMAIGARLGARFLSPFGLSLLGSAAHAGAQLGVLSLWSGGPGMLSFLPLFGGLALATGALTGFLADALLARLALARRPLTLVEGRD